MIWGGYVLEEENEDEKEEAEEIEEEEQKKPESQPIIKPTTKQIITQSNTKPPASAQKPPMMTSSMANSGGIRRSSVNPTIGQQNKTSTVANSNSPLASISSTQRMSSAAAATHQQSSQSSQMKASSTPMNISNSMQSPPPPSEKRRFEGKVVIVTESNCGIDRAVAVLLGKEGAKVTLHGTDEDELRRTIIRMMRADIDQDDILIVQGPIENEQTLKNLVERTLKKFGKIDILINNAGKITHSSNSNNHLGYRNGGGEEEEDEDSVSSGGGGNSRLNKYTRRKSNFHRNSMWQMEDSHNFDLLFNINLKSITNLTRLCLPHLEDTKGSVVNVTSFGSQQAFSDYANYSTAKTALDNYCRSIAIKYAKKNIRVNNVNPGFITTESADDTEVHVNKFYLNWIKNHVPMGRGGTAEEVAKVIGFLASDDSSYITGATIVCDGAVSIFSKPSDFF